ncbi:putative peptidase [Aquisphaera giovannonii]|uniref:Putative peptidase n=1 Tax=Aquisphaera giovannonii TaxID=406548 RepID=A0A5B9WCT1_9BACT|nr:Xaa-Pro peptidase family protein [Aquisphaera giovannonii]QEH38303.1 putative peptidase [Aquisphaera giovannonii]
MERIPRRRESLRRKLAEGDLDALLVTSETNVSYLSGFTGDSSVMLLGRDGDGDVILSDGRFTTQIEQECPGLTAIIRPATQTMVQAVAEAAKARGIRRLGFESAALTVAEFDKLREALKEDAALRPTAELVEDLRQIKDESEVAAIREAIAFAEGAFTAVRAGLKPGMTEKQAADRIESEMRRLGATGASFPPIVAVGLRAALPHARPTEGAKIGDAPFVLIDWGATGRPYKSDLTRMVVTGKVTPEFETVYRTVLEAQERAIRSIRPGARAHDVDAEARSVIEDAGFGRFFDHGLGHGVGMEIHEAPRLRRQSETLLKPGMIFTVEPGIYLPEWGGVRIEDDVLVTPEGCEVLSHLPKAIDTVCL